MHLNPTHLFTNDLGNCTWTEKVTNCPQGFIVSDSGGDWIHSVVMQRCGFGKIELVSLDPPPLPYQVTPINSPPHLFREKQMFVDSYWRVCSYWRNCNYLPALMTGGLNLPVCLNLFNNSCLISTSCDDKSLHLTAFIIERYFWDTSCETVV